MGKLSVIIVNYNVKYFLEHALASVQKAMEGIEGEVFVVDNASSDGSVEMVRQRFPKVRLIANQKNVGFSKANNQAIRESTGEYVLLLNPDTVVQEDTFRKVVDFMDAHPDAGGLGVKMIDGKGNFLPESKRAFPSPRVAFYKAFGLSALFPKSKTFGRYHLGHLPEDETAEVEVLAGAFMLIRKSVLDEIGLLDETFFMYGEDIDLSYRIVQAGYKNYYFPETQIIHYKGESTKKGSLNYVRMFYEAMAIFVRKHFGSSKARTFSLLIQAAIWFKAILHFLATTFKNSFILLLDAALMYGGLFLIKDFWATEIKDTADYYPWEYTALVLPAYVLLWLITIYFSGGYDRPYRITKALRGLLVGTVAILVLYGLLDESLRFSRAIILLGTVWGGIAIVGSRYLLHFIRHGNLRVESTPGKNLVIVGGPQEGDRVLSLLKQAGVYSQFIGFIAPDGKMNYNKEQVLGDLEDLEDIVEVFDVDEVIFCGKDLSSRAIIQQITKLGNEREFKIVPEASLSIIGSNSKDTAGDLYAIDVNLSIATAMQRRNKRVLDLLLCGLFIPLLPILFFRVKSVGGFLSNWWKVLWGRKSWVGYCPGGNGQYLPDLKPGVLCPQDGLRINKDLEPQLIRRLNLQYARDYETRKDVVIVWRGVRMLGR